MPTLPAEIDGVPNISGADQEIRSALAARPPSQPSGPPFDGVSSAFAVALHMHQPLIPAGGTDLHTAGLISNLQYMMRAPRHRRQPQRPRLSLVLPADGRVHTAS